MVILRLAPQVFINLFTKGMKHPDMEVVEGLPPGCEFRRCYVEEGNVEMVFHHPDYVGENSIRVAATMALDADGSDKTTGRVVDGPDSWIEAP